MPATSACSDRGAEFKALNPVSAPTGRGDREDLPPTLARDQSGQDSEPYSVGGLVADPGDLTTQHRVLVPQRQYFHILGHPAT